VFNTPWNDEHFARGQVDCAAGPGSAAGETVTALAAKLTKTIEGKIILMALRDTGVSRL